MHMLLLSYLWDFLAKCSIVSWKISVPKNLFNCSFKVEFISWNYKPFNKRKLCEMVVSLLVQNYMRHFWPVIWRVVDSCVISILISYLFDYTYSGVRHLQQRSQDGPIVRIIEESAICVCKVRYLNLFENVAVKGHQVSAWQIPRIPESILIKHFLIDIMAEAKLGTIIIVNGKEVTVGHGCILALIHGVKEWKYIPTNKRIVPINDNNNLTRLAILMNSQMNVRQSFLILLVYNDFNFLFRYVLFLQVLLDELAGLVGRTVVDVDDMVVIVVLHEDWVQVT